MGDDVKRVATDLLFGFVGIADALPGTANALANLVAVPVARALGSDFRFPEEGNFSRLLTSDPRSLAIARKNQHITEVLTLVVPFAGEVAAARLSAQASRVARAAASSRIPAIAGTQIRVGETTLSGLRNIRGVVDVRGSAWRRAEMHTAGWYEQISGFTCQPSSIANALVAMGARLDTAAFSKVIERVATSRSGISMTDAVAALGERMFRVLPVPVAKTASVLEKARLSDGQLWSVISHAVDQRRAVLGGVRFKSYNGGAGRHAIAITGYAETAAGERAVKIMDSEVGVFWMKLTDLNRSLESDRLFVLAAN